MAKDKKKQDDAQEAGPPPTPRLQEKYEQDILPALKKALGRENRHALPKVEKIVVSMGVGKAISDKKYLDEAVRVLADVTGQKAAVCRARKSVAGFRLREDQAIGAKVTLRRQRMYEFLDRLISLVLPRVRDFRGLNPNAFDGNGNYNLGLNEQLVFPEIDPDKYALVQGLNVTIVTSATSDDEGRELLSGFGMPFQTEETAAA